MSSLNLSRSLVSFALTLVVTASAVSIASNASAQGYYNPEIYDSGVQISNFRYDPFSGRIIVRTDRRKVRESAFDPNRSNIDPGSYRVVNRYETDLNGVRWHITGTEWTSGGRPHGNLNRRRVVDQGNGIVEDKNESVIFSATSTNGLKNAQKPGTPKSGYTKPGSGFKPHQSLQRFTVPSQQHRSAKPSVSPRRQHTYSPF